MFLGLQQGYRNPTKKANYTVNARTQMNNRTNIDNSRRRIKDQKLQSAYVITGHRAVFPEKSLLLSRWNYLFLVFLMEIEKMQLK